MWVARHWPENHLSHPPSDQWIGGGDQSNCPIRAKKKAGSSQMNLGSLLWSYRIMSQSLTRENPFMLAFRIEVVIPVEVGILSLKALTFDENQNFQDLWVNLDLIQKVRTSTELRSAICNQKTIWYFNWSEKEKQFQIGNLIFRKVEATDHILRKLDSNWERPFLVAGRTRFGVYKLEGENRKEFLYTWNAKNLRGYYI